MRYRFIILFTVVIFSISPAQTIFQFVQRLESLSQEKRNVAVQKFFLINQTTPIVEQDSLLHFVFYGKAGSIGVNGNLQYWNAPDELTKIECGDSSFFYRTYIVPPNARLDYQLVIDGKYQLDPRNPNHTPSGFGTHSEVRMPKFISSPYLIYRDSVPHGKIDSISVNTSILPPLQKYLIAGRKIKIYLPPGYNSLSYLPSVYIHDGFEAIDYALVPTVIDNLIATKKIEPIIAVFIPPVRREEEYIRNSGDRFVNFLCDNLVSKIDKRYKTDSSPYKRAMMGISAGGYIALYTVIRRPDVFQNVGGQSTTITQSLINLTKKQSEANRVFPQLKIYLDCGRFDIKENDNYTFLEMNRKYSALLSLLRVPHYFKEVNDGHEWASWRERMPGMLIYFFGRYQ